MWWAMWRVGQGGVGAQGFLAGVVAGQDGEGTVHVRVFGRAGWGGHSTCQGGWEGRMGYMSSSSTGHKTCHNRQR